MGRRKIEIKAIKDDRNRSVTFLKRKGGLFKKAHELSVLCSVDVAVIIFGNNKKLYEYSSSDIGEILTRYQYCGGANEHKGPADFSGKGKMDDDYDDDDGSAPSHHGSVEPQMMPHQFQNQAAYQHMRHHTPSASPPIPPGAVFPHPHHQPQRQHTPQPQLPDGRPTSRNATTRTSSNLVPQHSQSSNGYTYMTNLGMYSSHNPAMPPHPHPHPHTILPHLQGPSMQGLPMQSSQYTPPPTHQQLHPHQQIQQAYQEEQRKASMPPMFPKDRPSSRPESSPPQPPQPQQHVADPPPQDEEVKQEPQPPQQIPAPVKKITVKSRSIFTPIDESRSILSQHWASSTAKADPPRNETGCSTSRSQSLINGADQSEKYPTPPVCAQSQTQNRTSDVPAPDNFQQSSRSYSSSQGGGKRPVLKVQIPDEPSDEESVTAISSSSPSATNASSYSRRNGNTTDSLSSGVVLPPPSPSASSLLSAGAAGPPNPFARPHSVPQNQQPNPNNGNNNTNVSNGNIGSSNITNNNMGNNKINNNNIINSNISNNSISSNANHHINNNNHAVDTPVSALPSRFMNNDFLPSPNSFLEWNFSRGGDANALPSPLNFATPIIGTGPSFLREDMSKEISGNPYVKRKSPEEEKDAGQAKRLKND